MNKIEEMYLFWQTHYGPDAILGAFGSSNKMEINVKMLEKALIVRDLLIIVEDIRPTISQAKIIAQKIVIIAKGNYDGGLLKNEKIKLVQEIDGLFNEWLSMYKELTRNNDSCSTTY